MSADAVDGPVRARPDVPSAIQTEDPEDPGPVQPLGREAAAAVAVAVAAEEERVEVKSALRLRSAEDTAKRVRALGPPQIVEGSPAQGMLQSAVLVSEAPLLIVFEQ